MANLQKKIGDAGEVTEKQLGQARPADTTAVSIYSPASRVITTEITSIVVCNTTGGAVTYRIFVDDNGATYDQTTALYYDVSLAANTSIVLEPKIFMNDTSGNIAVRTGTNSALTFTVFGKELKTLNP